MNYSESGKKTLEVLSSMDKFSDWMYREIKPFLGGRILEIGSGSGNYSKRVIEDFSGNLITLSDIDQSYLLKLKKDFSEYPNVSVINLDLSRVSDFKSLSGAYDSVFALNVLEHIENDITALKNIESILRPQGKAVLLVPAHKMLFNAIDQHLGHFRRYSRKDLSLKINSAGLSLQKLFYFNFISIPGWFIYGNFLKKSVVPSAARILEPFIPFIASIEKNILRNKIGISIIAVVSNNDSSK